jgi:DNA-binding XRE family transcriptional regulator
MRASFPILKESDLVAARILCKQCLGKHCRRIRIISRTLGDVDNALNGRLLKALGQRIRELRSDKGYSQEAFADHCGVHRTFMGTVERGESNLSFQNIVRIATALGVSLSALFAGIEDQAESLHSGEKTAKRRIPRRKSTA